MKRPLPLTRAPKVTSVNFGLKFMGQVSLRSWLFEFTCDYIYTQLQPARQKKLAARSNHSWKWIWPLLSDQIPTVVTTDSTRGKEAKLVIYDWVISSSNKSSSLGFAVDDGRGFSLSKSTGIDTVTIYYRPNRGRSIFLPMIRWPPSTILPRIGGLSVVLCAESSESLLETLKVSNHVSLYGVQWEPINAPTSVSLNSEKRLLLC